MTTTCRKCGNRVFTKELFCPDCGASAEVGRKPLLAGVLLVLIIACSAWLVWHFASSDPDSEVTALDDRREAWYAALEVCWEFLDSPTDAQFPSYGGDGTGVDLRIDGIFEVVGYVNVPNEVGERERRSWEVQLSLDGDLWQAEYLRLGDREYSGTRLDGESSGEREMPDAELSLAVYNVASEFASGLGGAYEGVVTSYNDEGSFIDPVGPGEYDVYGRLEIPERGPGSAVWMGRVETDPAGGLSLQWIDVQGFGRYSPDGATVIRGLEERTAIEGREEASVVAEEVAAPRLVRLVVGRDVELLKHGETVVEAVEAGTEVEVLESNEGILTIRYQGGEGEIPVYFTDY